MLSARERDFVDRRRIGHLATADRSAVPHVVPVCFGLAEDRLYITIDQKPKRARERPLRAAGPDRSQCLARRQRASWL